MPYAAALSVEWHQGLSCVGICCSDCATVHATGCMPQRISSLHYACMHAYVSLLRIRAGVQGRKRFKLYQQLLAFGFALVQAAGQEFYLKPYVPEWSVTWFVASLAILSGGAMVLVKVLPAPQTACRECHIGSKHLMRLSSDLTTDVSNTVARKHLKRLRRRLCTDC